MRETLNRQIDAKVVKAVVALVRPSRRLEKCLNCSKKLACTSVGRHRRIGRAAKAYIKRLVKFDFRGLQIVKVFDH